MVNQPLTKFFNRKVLSYENIWGFLFVFVIVANPLLTPFALLHPGSAKIQPVLRQIITKEPDDVIDVIVQSVEPDNKLEALVSQWGGRVTQDLSIINAFAAKMKAKDVSRLAQMDGVRWVSLNARMRQMQAASTTTFTTWATSLGVSTTNGFTSPEAMVSSALGPDNSFGFGSKTRGAFGGFDSEVTPGFAITKVEVILHAYVQAQLKLGQDPKVSVSVGGVSGATVTVNHNAFDANIGAGLAGPTIVDITNTRTWKWADFANNLEVLIDQSKFATDQFINYDAIGLRVTSSLGTDNSATANLSSLPKTAIDTSKLLNVYNTTVRAATVWNEAPGYLQGQGISIAVVDSGLGKDKELSGRIGTNVNFNQAYHDSNDRYGHGTFVAGIVGANGQASQGQYIGIAPKANLINVRVSNDEGMATEADVVSALQWVLQNKSKYNIRVVNLSLNSSMLQSYHTSPLDAAAEILWFNNIVVVVAAGNSGQAHLYPPANDPFVITVGATDDKGTSGLTDDTLAPFSAYGTTEVGTTKPELVAPGTNIKGYLPGSNRLTIGMQHKSNIFIPDFFQMSGTSMAAPIVSGAVALLLQDEPNLTSDQVKYRFMATANKNWSGYNATKAGAGYLDIYAAVHGTTTQSANTNLTASQLLWTGGSPVTWGSVNWNSVNWNSVNWNSVNWNSVNWNSVNWNSDHWDTIISASTIDHTAEAMTTTVQNNYIFLPVVKR